MRKLWIGMLLLPMLSVAQHKMEWFADAKLGIFIHWGIYAVNEISESWSLYNGYISHEDYLQQTEGFIAKHKEAIYGTRQGIPYDHFYGPTALSKDSTTLYLYIRDLPKDGKIDLYRERVGAENH